MVNSAPRAALVVDAGVGSKGDEGGLFGGELGLREAYRLRRRAVLVTVTISPGLGDWEFEEPSIVPKDEDNRP